MNSLINTSVAVDADRDRKAHSKRQREHAGAWHLPHISPAENACTGNCEQGRRCSCALSSGRSCHQAEGQDAFKPASTKEAELLSQMAKLLTVTLGLSLLAWVLA
ncbi:hypothetical protein [Roseateles sp.]|uniref:hypothetical protein n=1 Tax=Roseateles sp. TaxID=1971397 RepID=UPI00286B6E18|nr:hypothetical protein [Roseateles sp.]